MRRFICLFCIVMLLSVSLPAFSEGTGLFISEEDGGEFRPLPINLEGGSPLPYTQKIDKKFEYYEDPTIRVERYRVDRSPEFECTYWYALITVRDPSQLRTASASETKPFQDNQRNTCSVISRRKKAVLAINGDYCATFSGVKASNYILRQGTVYRETVTPGLDLLLIDEDGDFHVITAGDADLETVDKTQIDGKKVINALQFGPALVIDGKPVADDIVLSPDHSPVYSNPHQREQRMCICQIDRLHYMVLCCASWGANLATLRDIAMSLAPVQTVYTLDGGNSSQMVFLGTQLNAYANGNKEIRPITDIIYFASAWFTE